jgi:threonyl-tRNA synthetase
MDPNNNDPYYALRHSSAHLMAQAVGELYPGVKFAIGPPIEDGFYYDFDLPESVGESDLPRIEEKMREVAARDLPIHGMEMPPDQAVHFMEELGQPYKVELINDLLKANPDEKITFFEQGDHKKDGWIDLCRGNHVPSLGHIKHFKLLSTAGAYWRGSEKNKMLTRIYGTAWPSQQELEDYLNRLEEAKKRDHRVLGHQLKIFAFSDEVGKGFPLWLPRGAAVRRVLENFVVETEARNGYEHVYTPPIAKTDLYKTSGHLAHYQEHMFPIMKVENEEYVLRPMNCPHHIEVYRSRGIVSYRDLPVRIAELGQMFRYEPSGTLTGLSRVRMMVLSDAHIFCREDQIQDEFINVVKLIDDAYRKLGLTDFTYRLSLHDPADKEKYVDNPQMWETAEGQIRSALQTLGVPFYEAVGEAAFYGPKLDVQLKSVLGKEETISTSQVDYHLPERFKLEYIGDDGQVHQPVMIHRGYLSTMERMIAFLLEHYAGAFPLWLAPVQVTLLPISDAQHEYAAGVAEQLRDAGFRVEVDARSERVGKKIAEAEVSKSPYMLIMGKRDVEAGAVSVRKRGEGDLGAVPIADFIDRLKAEV